MSQPDHTPLTDWEVTRLFAIATFGAVVAAVSWLVLLAHIWNHSMTDDYEAAIQAGAAALCDVRKKMTGDPRWPDALRELDEARAKTVIDAAIAAGTVVPSKAPRDARPAWASPAFRHDQYTQEVEPWQKKGDQ